MYIIYICILNIYLYVYIYNTFTCACMHVSAYTKLYIYIYVYIHTHNLKSYQSGPVKKASLNRQFVLSGVCVISIKPNAAWFFQMCSC